VKIKSNYKDYYDHVAHIYGGGDPKFVYARVPIAADRCCGIIDRADGYELEMNRLYNRNFKHNDYQYKYLVIAGKRYLLSKKWTAGELIPLEFTLFTEKNFPEEYAYARNNPYRRISYDKEIGGEYPILTEIARMVGAPVYCINSVRWTTDKKYQITVDQNIPVLANYDIPTIISPEQLYQDLSYYVANTMHPSPDLIVNDNQSNREKILGHGFDVKQSFRHRK
jgi:hypothetical protein